MASLVMSALAHSATTAKSWAERARETLAHQAGGWYTYLLMDMGLAIVTAAATMLFISAAAEPGSRAPDMVAYILGGVIGAVLLMRRRWPLATLLISAAILFIYYSLNYPGIAPALPLAVALYTAVTAGRLRWGLSISAFFIATGLLVTLIHRHDPLLPTLGPMTDQAALLAVVLLLGEAVRNRRQYMAEVRERLQRTEREREREAARLVAEERLRIARDLHDVMAHTITAITVQAGLALDALDDSPMQTRTSLAAIRTASREAMSEIKATIGVLRSDEEGMAPRSPTPTLDQIEQMIDKAQNAGLRIEATVAGTPRPLSAAVSAAAYRIVQESVTNILRHSGAHHATITICYEPAALRLEIADSGGVGSAIPSAGSPERIQQGGGHGLLGMKERAASLTGWLKAGPQSGGGFVVQAWLPTGEEIRGG